MKTDEAYLRETFLLAGEAREAGDHPFGALLVMDGEVVLVARNQVIQSGDVTRHAELLLVSEACKQFNATALAGATLYSSTEPCAMCAGAIGWSGIGRVVFGCAGPWLGELVGETFVFKAAEILARARHVVSVRGPMLVPEAQKVHQGFWV